MERACERVNLALEGRRTSGELTSCFFSRSWELQERESWFAMVSAACRLGLGLSWILEREKRNVATAPEEECRDILAVGY